MSDAEYLSSQPIILDSGASLIKSGFAGSELPQSIIPTYVARSKYQKVMNIQNSNRHSGADQTVWLGDQARELRGICRLSYPLRNPAAVQWGDLQLLWEYIYSHELQSDAKMHPLLLTETSTNTKANRSKTCELLYEGLQVPALYIQNQSILSLYASGRTSGLIVDSGDSHTTVTPVIEGYILHNAIEKSTVGGYEVTSQLQSMLRKNGYSFYSSSEYEIIRDIKERLAYVQYKAADSVKQGSEDELPYKLPDGQTIHISSEKHLCTELLFNPLLVGNESDGVHQMILNSIGKCDVDIRRNLFSSIVLSGGNTLFDGYGDRLLYELKRASQRDTRVKIAAPNDRILSSYIGGSILSSLSSFKNMWCSKKEYEEMGGQTAVHRKLMG